MSPLPLPGNEISYAAAVRSRWELIAIDINKGIDRSTAIDGITKTINDAEDALRSRRLDPEKDWQLDIEMARKVHELHLEWAKFNKNNMDAWYGFWQQRLNTNHDFVIKLVLDGLKFILALHSGAALACFAALASERSGSKGAIAFGLGAASIGLLMLGLGKILLIEAMSRHYNKIIGKIVNRRGWLRLRAISRWLDLPRQQFAPWIATILIYGFICWFAIYMIIFIVILIA